MDFLRWALSGPLLLAGGLLCLGNWISILGAAIGAVRSGSGSTSLVLPCVGGVLLSAGMLVLPIDLPFNRFVMAFVAACFDLSLMIVLVVLIAKPFQKMRKQFPDSSVE